MHRFHMIESKIYIGQSAKYLNVSVDTLRRWDESGKLHANKSKGGQRWYLKKDLDFFKLGVFELAKSWITGNAQEPDPEYYCPTTMEFKGRLPKLQFSLEKIERYKNTYSLIVAMAGEIGNNSYDHNLGNWPDVQGAFFAFDTNRKQIALADRGLGVLRTLRRIRPELKSDKEALNIAFTEILSGRAPESRGNGLKFVRSVALDNKFKLQFFSGNASVVIDGTNTNNTIKFDNTDVHYSGCLALIGF